MNQILCILRVSFNLIKDQFNQQLHHQRQQQLWQIQQHQQSVQLLQEEKGK